MPSTRNSKPRSTSSAKNPIVLEESRDDPNPTPTLGNIYPTESDTEPKINPALLTSNSVAFQRLTAGLKIVPPPPQSSVSIQDILSASSYQSPRWIEYMLGDYYKYGIDVNDANILFKSLDKPTFPVTVAL